MKWKKHFDNVLRLKKTPASIALGFAVGTLIAALPTFGFGPALAFILIFIFTKINKISLFGAFVIWNPIILSPLYILSFQLGNLILGTAPIVTIELSVLDTFYSYSIRFLLGNIIIAISLAIISYYIVLIMAKKIQKRE